MSPYLTFHSFMSIFPFPLEVLDIYFPDIFTKVAYIKIRKTCGLKFLTIFIISAIKTNYGKCPKISIKIIQVLQYISLSSYLGIKKKRSVGGSFSPTFLVHQWGEGTHLRSKIQLSLLF